MTIRPQVKNANRHTARGMQALETSLSQDGWIGAITVAADGETFDGSARVEKTAENGMLDDAPDEEPLVIKAQPNRTLRIESDGTSPLIHIRTDIPTATDARAVRLGIAANRVASLNLEWEPDILTDIIEQGIELPPGLFYANELALLSQPNGEPVDPAELWRGMPDFEQEDLESWKAIKVHFANEQDYHAFARLIEQTLTPQSKSIWYPYQAQENLLAYKVEDES